LGGAGIPEDVLSEDQIVVMTADDDRHLGQAVLARIAVVQNAVVL
jgi:hypothetical protein